MPRPKLPDEALKHPRRKRRSTTVGEVNTSLPEPSKRALKRWQPILEVCCRAVLTNEPLNTLPIKNKVRIKFSSKRAIPKGFPLGRYVDENVLEYNAELVLLWMYENKLSPYSPNMLYKERQKFLAGITKLLDVGIDSLYNDCIKTDLEEN